MIKILANDGIDPIGKKMLEDAGFIVDTNNIPQDELPARLNEYDAITVRSATKVRKALIDATPNLKLIGRGGVGVDNIDVEYAKEKGAIALIRGLRAVSDFARENLFWMLSIKGGTKYWISEKYMKELIPWMARNIVIIVFLPTNWV